MHLMYYMDEQGKRIYTLKVMEGVPQSSVAINNYV